MLTPALKNRLRALEELYASMGECSCRVEETTLYHDSVELQAILQETCAVHEFRELGDLMWVGTALSLRCEDQQFCSCASSPLRELLLGRHGPLTAQEHAEEEDRWIFEYGAGSDERFRRDQEQIKQLLRNYEYKKLTGRY